MVSNAKQLAPSRAMWFGEYRSGHGKLSMHFINKGSFGCAIGMAVMMASMALAGIIFIKCFGLAYKPEYSLTQYISALFTRHALSWYLGTGVLFALGLWLTINAMITILKDFFEV